MRSVLHRKHNRLVNHDYSRNGLYFITICTKDRVQYLCDIQEKNVGEGKINVGDGDLDVLQINKITPIKQNVGDAALGVPQRDIIIKPFVKLTNIGKIVNDNIRKIDSVYDYVSVKKYVIMPDHIHIVLFVSDYFDDTDGTPRAASPTKSVPLIINALKSISTKQIGFSIWQRSYFDHIIRSENEFSDICNYIENNPINWANNKFNLNKWR